jgi:Na+-driven multidrug efflux pump
MGSKTNDERAAKLAAAQIFKMIEDNNKKMMMELESKVDKYIATFTTTGHEKSVAQIAVMLRVWHSLFVFIAAFGVLYVDVFLCLDEVTFKVFAGLVSMFIIVLYLRIDILSRAIWKNKWCLCLFLMKQQ